MEKRHEMCVYGADESNRNSTSKWIQIYLPDLGEVTITYESNTSFYDDETPRPVFQFSFDPSNKIRIIDHRGNDKFMDWR